MARVLRILAAEAMRYEDPSARHHGSRVLVEIVADFDGRQIRSLGEGKLGAGGKRHGGWRDLTTLLPALPGTAVDVPEAPASLDSIRACTDTAFDHISLDPTTVPAGIRLAIEMSLLDLITRARRVSLPGFLGRKAREVSLSAITLLPRPRRADAVDKILSLLATHPPGIECVRLGLTGSLDWDLEVLGAVLEYVDSGSSQPPSSDQPSRQREIWVEGRGGFDREAASELLSRLADRGVGGATSPPIYLEQPCPGEAIDDLLALQQEANSLSHRAGARQMAVIANASARSVDEVCRLVAGGIGGINLDLPGWGSIVDLLAVAQKVTDDERDVVLALTGSSTMSDVTGWAAHSLATTAQFDRVFQVRPTADGPGLATPALAYQSGGPTLEPGSGEGVTASLDRTDLVPYLTAFDHAPSKPHQRSANLKPINAVGSPAYTGPSPSNQMFQLEALAGGLSVTRYSPYLFTADDGSGSPTVGFDRGRCDVAELAHQIAWSKALSKTFLDAKGLPTPMGRAFEQGQESSAMRFGRSVGFPLVVKPIQGRKGVGISTGIGSPKQLSRAIELANSSRFGRSGFIVERHYEGYDYRLLVLGGQVISVVLREPAHVIGDGRRTIVELATEKNLERRKNHHLALGRLLEFNDDALRTLEDQGLRPESVPQQGDRVALRSVANQSAGGESSEVLQETHPELLDLAVRAVAAVPGLEHGGVDLILSDHRLPLRSQPHSIIEINDSPAMGLHHWVMFGEPKKITRKVANYYLRKSGLTLGRRQQHISVELTVQGNVQGVGYRRWIQRQATRQNLSGWVYNESSGAIRAVMSGRAHQISAVAAHAIRGPRRAQPTSVRCVPMEHQQHSGFELRDLQGSGHA